jgi:hypothetical protein
MRRGRGVSRRRECLQGGVGRGLGGELGRELGVVAAVGDGNALVLMHRRAAPNHGQGDGEEHDVGHKDPERAVGRIEVDHHRRQEQGRQGDGDHAAPSEVHELIEAEAGKGPAHPHIEEEEEDDFAPEHDEFDEDVDPAADFGLIGAVVNELVDPGEVPAAEEECDHDGSAGDHGGIFGEEEEGEFHGGVFGVVAADEFGFALSEIERGTVGFGEDGGGEDEGGDRVDEDVPLGDDAEPIVGLGGGHGFEVEGADGDEDAHEGDGEGDFVGEHLGGGAKAAEEGVFGTGGPSAEDDAVGGEAGHRQDDENADGDIGDHEGEVDGKGPEAEDGGAGLEDAPPGDDGVADHGGGEDGDGGEDEEEFVGVGGDEFFLEDELHAVDDGLEEALGPGAVGADAVLDPSSGFAFEEDEVRDQAKHHLLNDDGENDFGDEKTDGISIHGGRAPRKFCGG